MAEDRSAFAAHVDGDAIYALLMAVDKKVDRIEAAVATTQDKVEDHEDRLRAVESHGSTQAQEVAQEMLRTRTRLHALEGTAAVTTALVQENMTTIAELRSTLIKVTLLAVGAVFTALATLVVYLVVSA